MRRNKEILPPLDAQEYDFLSSCYDRKTGFYIIHMAADIPDFGISAGDTLIGEKVEPKRGDVIAFSLAENPAQRAVAISRFVSSANTLTTVENPNGSRHVAATGTIVVIRLLIMELRMGKRSKE